MALGIIESQGQRDKNQSAKVKHGCYCTANYKTNGHQQNLTIRRRRSGVNATTKQPVKSWEFLRCSMLLSVHFSAFDVAIEH